MRTHSRRHPQGSGDAGELLAHQMQDGFGTIAQIGMAECIAVHRAVVEGLQGDRREHVMRQHASVAPREDKVLDRQSRASRRPGQDVPRLVEQDPARESGHGSHPAACKSSGVLRLPKRSPAKRTRGSRIRSCIARTE